MAENLAARGIKDKNEGLTEPRFRTVADFIFSGSQWKMRELAFGRTFLGQVFAVFLRRSVSLPSLRLARSTH